MSRFPTLASIQAVLLGTLPLAAPYSTAAESQAGVPANLRNVVVVFKTHFDIGYTDLAVNVVQRYRTTMIDQALAVVDQNRDLPADQQFVWTLPGWPMAKIGEGWEGQTSERQRRIQQAFRDGRFVVHALPFTTHTELLEPEDLVRGLGFSSRLARGAGLPLPRDAKMTDVPCHAWIMPTLLRHAGVDFLHLGCNAASSSPRVPTLFWWEGPDGSRLLTMYSAAGYGTGLVPPSDWPYQTWLALIHTGDNHGPPTPREVKALLAEAAAKLPGVTVRIGRLSDFADQVMAEKAEIPVVRGDMPDSWIHGPMCDPAGARLAREVRPEIAMTESLNTLLPAWGVATPTAAETIAAAYERSLLYGEHTWGGALAWVTPYGAGTKWGYGDVWRADHQAGRFRRLEDSWAEHTSYIEKAGELVRPLLATQLRALAQSVAVSGRRVVVFNPLPWRRDGVVPLPLSAAGTTALRPVEGGPPLPVARDGAGLQFVARDVPPLGYRTFVPVAEKAETSDLRADEQEAVLENRWLKLTLDPARGAIRSLIDKPSGRECVDAAAPHGFGQYLYERFDARQVADYVRAYVKITSDWAINELGKPSMPPAEQVPYQSASPASCTLAFERTAGSVAAVLRAEPTAALGHGVTTRVILRADQPCVDVELTVHSKPADPWPEAGWICLPFLIDSPRFRLGRPGSVIDPATEIVPGANRNLFGIDTGVAICDASGRGAGFCSLDSPLVSLDTPGCWKYSLDFVPRKPTAYVNLFNNQWTTNFRLWNAGTWSWRVRIWVIDRFDAETSLVTPSLEARYPLQAAVSEGPSGALPAARTGLELSTRGSLVTALGPNPDGEGIVLRVWELAGQSGPCQVRLPAGMAVSSVQPVDLRGRRLGAPIVAEQGGFTFDRQAFAPASFVLVTTH